MKKVAAVVSAVVLTGSLVVGQTQQRPSSTNPANVSEPDDKPEKDKKRIDNGKDKKGGKKHHKSDKKDKKGASDKSTAAPKF